MILLHHLLVTLILGAPAFGYNSTSRLQVQIPRSLYKAAGYEHRDAMFGVYPYGRKIVQNVYYDDLNLCYFDPKRGYPLRPLDANGTMEPWPSPFILMVDRGDCTFVTKVRNAQRVGATAVLIANNLCGCEDEACWRNPNFTVDGNCESTTSDMSDDGSGSDVSIPSFLMRKSDADAIKQELKRNRIVQVEMSWNGANPDDRVEYDIWMTPTDYDSNDFIQQFKTVLLALGKSAHFTPHMYIYDGTRLGCQSFDGTNQCYTLCTNGGRYCAMDPDQDLDAGISGADVVKESLRRICIWKYYGEDDGIGEKWWNYVSIFPLLCDTPTSFNSETCINEVYKQTGINGKYIATCMENSGGLTLDQGNAILDMQIQAQTNYGVTIIPSVFVNNFVLRGGLSMPNVFSAICAGLAPGTEPNICLQCASLASTNDQYSCIYQATNDGILSIEYHDGIAFHTFVLSLLLVVAIVTGLGIWYYRRSREDMRERVRGILAEYMPLEDQDETSHQTSLTSMMNWTK